MIWHELQPPLSLRFSFKKVSNNPTSCNPASPILGLPVWSTPQPPWSKVAFSISITEVPGFWNVEIYLPIFPDMYIYLPREIFLIEILCAICAKEHFTCDFSTIYHLFPLFPIFLYLKFIVIYGNCFLSRTNSTWYMVVFFFDQKGCTFHSTPIAMQGLLWLHHHHVARVNLDSFLGFCS